jgi:phage portal protein BeeE
MPNRIQRFISEARMRVGLDRPQDVVAAVGLYGTTVAGSNVTHDTSIRISTVYACVYKIASTLASLSLNLYSTDGRNRDIVYEHPTPWR